MRPPRQISKDAPDFAMWRQLIIDSFVRPRDAARRVLGLGLAPGVIVQAALAVTCLGVVLGYVMLLLAAGQVDPVSAVVLDRPFLGAATQLGVMAAVALATYRIGRAFGGQGDLVGAATVVVWLNAMMLMIQVAQLVAMALVPPLAGLIAIATFFWVLWAFANFTAELHDFPSPVMVLGVTILSVVVLIFGLAMLAAILGLGPQGGR